MSHDAVNHPQHYTDGGFIHSECGKPIEVIDITRCLSFTRGNAVKYILRAELKGKLLEDLKKAVWYLEDEIRRLEGPSKGLMAEQEAFRDVADSWYPEYDS